MQYFINTSIASTVKRYKHAPFQPLSQLKLNLPPRIWEARDQPQPRSEIMRSSTESYVTLRNTLRSLCYVALHVWQLHQNIT
jgi:hypothetical protein